METRTINVKGANNVEYPVIIGPGLLETTLPEFIAERGYKDVAIITNDTVGPLYGEALAGRIPSSYLITVPDGERYKTLKTIQDIYDTLLEHGADRSTVVVTLGGGVVGDMGGFAAASFMRGVRLIQCPTTLLSMVDSSVGSKVGVDLPQGKNLVGAFYDPVAVFADTAALSTLPPEEFSHGMAEVLKHGLLDDSWLLDYPPDSQNHDEMIERAVRVKVRVVEQDRLEKGIRAHLNLGHTFGHALEQVSGYAWKHGNAVAIGMAAAIRLSANLGLCDQAMIAEVETILSRWNLSTRYSGYSPESLWEAMHVDKKWQDGKARFVLLEGQGRPVIKDDVTHEAAIAALTEIYEEA